MSEQPPSNIVEFIPREEYERTFGPDGSAGGRTRFDAALENVANLPGALPKVVNRKRVVTAFLDAFELLGGTQRLVEFASTSDENYESFLKIYGRLAPPVTQAELEPVQKAIIHALPRTALDE